MAKQLSLLKDPRKNTKLWWIVKKTTYGGSLDYRKVRRPFDSKKLTHAVFKAKLGSAIWFTRSEKMIRLLIDTIGKRYGVRIKDVAVNRDHIHILFYTSSRESQIRFLRLFSAEMGRRYKTIKARLGVSAGHLWSARPFTRLVAWGAKSVDRIRKYIEKNRNEVMGFVEYQPRKHALTLFLHKWNAQAFSSA